MPRVDFYVLPDEAAEGPLPTACRLAEKAVSSGKRVHAHAPDEATAQEFDRLLWIYKQGGFVAHERLDATQDQSLAHVLIGSGAPSATHRDVLLNLGAEVPPFFAEFERVLEIVHGDAAARAASRARFKAYKDAGVVPETHKLEAA